MVAAEDGSAWGTWEELILAGAVLRHGTQAWGAIASELRARSLYPFSFTPEACEAKYKVLRRQYFGCKDLFEDLKKRRVEELRKELEKSDDSIGSLETKLENLKAEKESHSQIDSLIQVVKSEDIESFGKESPKEGLSAGSFTQNITKIISHQEKELSFKGVEASDDRERGKRESKDCNGESKEGSNGDSENLGSANVATSTMRLPKNLNVASPRIGNEYLMGIFSSIAENELALVFRRKLDSQKRARYRKMIRRHVDFDTLRSRVTNCIISSVKELFRDLLLLANNALVFYSKRTREYKTALLLREMVTELYKKHCRETRIRTSSSFPPIPELCNLPVKRRSFRPHPRKIILSTNLPVDYTDNSVDGDLKRCEKTSSEDIREMRNSQISKDESNIDFKPSSKGLMVKSKGAKRMEKVVRGSVKGQAKDLMNENKRSRRR